MENNNAIPSIRGEIDETDAEILRLLAVRRKLSQEIARAKNVNRSPIRDREREQELLIRRIRSGRDQGLDAHYVTKVFHEIIGDSIRIQQSGRRSIRGRAASTSTWVETWPACFPR